MRILSSISSATAATATTKEMNPALPNPPSTPKSMPTPRSVAYSLANSSTRASSPKKKSKKSAPKLTPSPKKPFTNPAPLSPTLNPSSIPHPAALPFSKKSPPASPPLVSPNSALPFLTSPLIFRSIPRSANSSILDSLWLQEKSPSIGVAPNT